MERNYESMFSENPINLDIQRSKFDRSTDIKFTGNVGDLIPFYVEEVLPGDTYQIDTSQLIRLTTPINPTMDNLHVDVYYYFEPYRLIWEHTPEFYGENRLTHWEQPTEYEIPQITAPTGGWAKGTIRDYMGLPINVDNISVSALPFRGYVDIWNNWFRDQNLKDPAMLNKDDATQTGSNTGDYVINAQLGAKPLKAAKTHDYFTSALPSPQKGPDVLLPIGGISGTLPVVGNGISIGFDTGTNLIGLSLQGGGNTMGYIENSIPVGTIPSSFPAPTTTDVSRPMGVTKDKDKSGLVALADTPATASTINALRQAFAIQKLFEKDARGGTRLTEIIKSHFGVTSPDARMQRPEYLGGTRTPINISAIYQTSSTDGTSPQGNAAAFSITANVTSDFTKSFTEPGLIYGLMVVRQTQHTYQQGIEKFWKRKSRFDYYWPSLANIGEMPIYNYEIYAQGNSEDNEVFGYQEAWADYRYKPSRVAGAFRSTYAQPLDSWHYGDYYTERPNLSSEWIDETMVNIDRTLTVTSAVEDQFIADFYIKCEATRPMPLYSIPGLIDHH